MAAVEEVTFRLERFGWSGTDRLKLVGRWHGASPEQLEVPVLVARSEQGERRIPALPASTRFDPDGRWSANFSWSPDLTDVAEVELELGRGLAVGLPLPNTHQRRFGRPSAMLPARVLEGAATAPAEDGGDAEAPESAVEDRSPLGLHAALIQAQQDRDEARAAAEHAREEAQLARHDAERERERRETEIVRMREGLATARAIAEEQLAEERAAAEERLAGERASFEERLDAERASFEERLGAERTTIEEGMAAERADLAAGRDQLEARLTAELSAAADLRGQLEQMTNTLAVERLKRSRLGEELDALRAEMERAGRREQALAERHATTSAEAEAAVESLRAELASARQDLADSANEVARRDHELERLRGRLAEAQGLADANGELSRQLEEAQAHAAEVRTLRAQLADVAQRADQLQAVQAQLGDAERRAEELQPLRARLAEVTAYARQVEPLRAELAEARSAVEETNAELDLVRRRLQAIRGALGE